METLVLEQVLLVSQVITSLALTIDATLCILLLARKYYKVRIN